MSYFLFCFTRPYSQKKSKEQRNTHQYISFHQIGLWTLADKDLNEKKRSQNELMGQKKGFTFRVIKRMASEREREKEDSEWEKEEKREREGKRKSISIHRVPFERTLDRSGITPKKIRRIWEKSRRKWKILSRQLGPRPADENRGKNCEERLRGELQVY